MQNHLFLLADISADGSDTNWGPLLIIGIGISIVLCAIYFVWYDWYHSEPNSPEMVFDVVRTEGDVLAIRFKPPYSWRDRRYQNEILAKVRYRRADMEGHWSEFGAMSNNLHKSEEKCIHFVTRMAA